MLVQIIAPGIATITTKKALGADKIGILNLAFWVNFFGSVSALFYYTCQYHLDTRNDYYLHYHYLTDLMDCGGILCTLIVTD